MPKATPKILPEKTPKRPKAKSPVPVCVPVVVHEDIVKRVQMQLPEDALLADLAELFHVFGDTTRMRILYVLFEEEVCVCDIASILSMSQSAISHQLRVLKQAKLVKNRREGKTIYYSLADDHVRTIVSQGIHHIIE